MSERKFTASLPLDEYKWTTHKDQGGSDWQTREVHGCTVYRRTRKRVVTCCGYSIGPGRGPSVNLQFEVDTDVEADALAIRLVAARDAALASLRGDA